jgi:hypothetical protein
MLITSGLSIAVGVDTLLARVGIKLPFYFDPFLVLLLPCLAFGIGNSEALKIIDGTNYIEARFVNSGPALKYLGRAGDYVFFWNSYDLDTEIHRLDSIQPLNLRQIRTALTAPQAGQVQPHK